MARIVLWYQPIDYNAVELRIINHVPHPQKCRLTIVCILFMYCLSRILFDW